MYSLFLSFFIQVKNLYRHCLCLFKTPSIALICIVITSWTILNLWLHHQNANLIHYEQEINNALSTANILKNPLSTKVKIMGILSNINDIDVFSIQIPTKLAHVPHFVKIRLSKILGLDIQLQILDKQGKAKLIVDDYLKNQGENIENFRLPQQDRFLNIAISPGSSAKKNQEKEKRYIQFNPFPKQTYYVTLNFVPIASNQEAEPNNSFKNASPIYIGKTTTGFFSPFKNFMPFQKFSKSPGKIFEHFELDFYSIANPRHVDINVTGTIGNTSQHIDVTYALFDASKNLIGTFNENPVGISENIQNLHIPAHEIRYLVISGVPDQFKIHSEHSYSYNITTKLVHASQSNIPLEKEPNNTLPKANPLLTKQKSIEGFLFPSGDIDIFQLPLEATPKHENEFLSVRLESLSSQDLSLAISSNNFIKIFDVNSFGESEIIHSFRTNQVPIFLTISSGSRSIRQEKTNKQAGYRLSWEIKTMTLEQQHEIEPNDSFHEKQNISILKPNEWFKGYINPGETNSFMSTQHNIDQDIYLMRLQTNQKYIVQIKTGPHLPMLATIFEYLDTITPYRQINIPERTKTTVHAFTLHPKQQTFSEEQNWYYLKLSGKIPSSTTYYKLKLSPS